MALLGMPGIGGSLGCCCWCGKTFVLEVLLNKWVATVHLEAFDDEFAIHDSCLPLLTELAARDAKDWRAMPYESPIRKAFERTEVDERNQARTQARTELDRLEEEPTP